MCGCVQVTHKAAGVIYQQWLQWKWQDLSQSLINLLAKWKKMKKRSANMRVSAVIWDLECKAMSQACWLHCCCCKLTQDKGHKWECNYDCSMPMWCSRISTGKRSSIYRGKFKAQLQAFTSRFISSKNKVSSLVWLWQASINKKTTL